LFVTQNTDILELIEIIDPIKYARTRNYLDGAVTKLSPYISRGVITTKQVARAVLSKGYKPGEIESFLKELAWRDYFQQVWIEIGSEINNDVRQVQPRVLATKNTMPIRIMSTGQYYFCAIK
jgi:deoxyribodipyrimidine photo-lyase